MNKTSILLLSFIISATSFVLYDKNKSINPESGRCYLSKDGLALHIVRSYKDVAFVCEVQDESIVYGRDGEYRYCRLAPKNSLNLSEKVNCPK